MRVVESVANGWGTVDLVGLDDESCDEVLDSHEGLGRVLNKWTGLVERLGTE